LNIDINEMSLLASQGNYQFLLAKAKHLFSMVMIPE